MEFNKDSVIKTILENHPNAEEILTSFGLHCLYCPCAQEETLEEACQVHGIDADVIVEKLNEEPAKKCKRKPCKKNKEK